MTERIIVVTVVAALVVVAVVVARRFRKRPSRIMAPTGLTPGRYLLTSDGCDTCASARDALEAAGTVFTEIGWQSLPEIFERLGIDAVPSSVEVESDGSARSWRGHVPGRWRR